METLEHEIEVYLSSRCIEEGWMCVKFIPDHRAGFPDRLILLPGGKCIWCELKRPKGGRLSPLQTVQHQILRRHGQEVHIVKNKEEAEDLIEKIKQSLN